MAAIDSLLGIVEMKKAAGVALASDEVPSLLTGGGRAPLTMPPLSAAMVEALLEETLSPADRQTLASAGQVETEYRSAGQGVFTVKARQAGAKVTLTVRKGVPAPRPATGVAAAPAVTVATSATAATVVTAASAMARHRPEPPAPGAHPLEALLIRAAAGGASDILLSSGTAPLLRQAGLLQPDPGPPIDEAALLSFFQPHLDPRAAALLDRTGSVDLALALPAEAGSAATRFRVNLFRHAQGLAAALRPIWTEIPSLSELHLPPALLDLVRPGPGLVLLTGAAGSGKSTTLAALVDHLNRSRACHVLTLEDPIEYLHRPARSIIHQRQVGRDVDSFVSGLRAALRERPDVLLVGEMRDPETIRLALTAAETGHLVLSTLHSGSAAMAIERVLDVFAESEKVFVRQQLAGVARAVVAQQLLPGTAGGLLPALEILTVNHAVAAQIRDGRTHMLATQMEIGGVEGMVPLERTLVELVQSGRVSRAAALAASPRPDSLQAVLDSRPRATRPPG